MIIAIAEKYKYSSIFDEVYSFSTYLFSIRAGTIAKVFLTVLYEWAGTTHHHVTVRTPTRA